MASCDDDTRLVSTSSQIVRDIFQNTTSVVTASEIMVTMNYYDPNYAADLKFIKTYYSGIKIRCCCHDYPSTGKTKSKDTNCVIS